MINNVVLTGWITYPVESKKSKNGKDFVTNAVTVARNYKQDGQYPVDIINFIAFGHKAKYIEDYVAKGDQVVVQGRLSSSQKTLKIVDEYGNIKERKINRVDLIVDEINRVHKKMNVPVNPETVVDVSDNESLDKEQISVNTENEDYLDILESFEEFEDTY